MYFSMQLRRWRAGSVGTFAMKNNRPYSRIFLSTTDEKITKTFNERYNIPGLKRLCRFRSLSAGEPIVLAAFALPGCGS
jgi:hypothetical protein